MLVIVQSMYIYIYIRTGLGWKNHFLGSNLGYTVFFYLQRCSCLGALTLEVFLDNAPLVFIDSLVRLYWCLCVSLVWKYVVTFVIHVMSMVVVDGLHGTLDILAIMSNRNPTDLCFFLDVWHANMLHTFFSRRQTFIYQLFKRSVINFFIIWCIIYFLLNGT